MSQKLTIEVNLFGHDLNCKHTISKVITENLVINKLKFHERMTRVAQQYCDRAQVKMETFEVATTNLEQLSGEVKVGYRWDSFYDFEDIQHFDKVTEQWPFTIVNNKALFELDLPELHVVHEI
ncbi:hypothetical protein RI845_06955 [Thalassotalea nanhaiensis]|uniref:Uncharacterized protein n=1 Tax=Thalassotalea nanhaiensis TaxID=3065648 RepID=A0ABY9TM22_9GAMM|nr:hypothetical protein RI845_06955 [Colwelliaceae bacterium SQ345]